MRIFLVCMFIFLVAKNEPKKTTTNKNTMINLTIIAKFYNAKEIIYYL